MTTIPMIAATMTEEQQAMLYAELGAYSKDEVAGVLLALFLGSFGAHHFYLGRTGLGVLYLLFFWTGIPAILGFIECFFMPSRVQRYNLNRAAMLVASMRAASPPMAVQVGVRHCPACGTAVAQGVRFCARCGAAVA